MRLALAARVGAGVLGRHGRRRGGCTEQRRPAHKKGWLGATPRRCHPAVGATTSRDAGRRAGGRALAGRGIARTWAGLCTPLTPANPTHPCWSFMPLLHTTMFSTCIRTRPAAMALGMGASGVRSSSSSSSIRLPVRTLTTASRVPQAMAVAAAAPRLSPPTRTPLWGSIAAFCTGFAAWATHTSVHCEEPAPSPAPAAENRDPLPDPSQPPPPKSIIDAKQLGFGTVAGICAGVFVKKGLKAIAFALGGVYILLQYLSSQVCVVRQWHMCSLTLMAPTRSGSRSIGAPWRPSTILSSTWLLADPRIQRLSTRPALGGSGNDLRTSSHTTFRSALHSSLGSFSVFGWDDCSVLKVFEPWTQKLSTSRRRRSVWLGLKDAESSMLPRPICIMHQPKVWLLSRDVSKCGVASC